MATAKHQVPKQNAFEILDVFIKTMLKIQPSNRNFMTTQTKATKKARAGLLEWGYRLDQANDLIGDARDMANIIRSASHGCCEYINS